MRSIRTRTRRWPPARAVALALGAALLPSQAAAASTDASVSPLPRSDYALRAACAAPAPGRAACMAVQLVPRTLAARAHEHPIGLVRAGLAPSAPPSPGAGDFGLRPQDLHGAYGLPTSAPGTQTIALVDAYNDPSAEADLATYSKQFGLPECSAGTGCFRQVNQNGEPSSLPFPQTAASLTKTEAFCDSREKGESRRRREEREEACVLVEEADGWALEIALDVETTHAVCQSCHIVIVEADSPTYTDLETAEEAAAGLGVGEISNSWAGPECIEGRCLGESSAFDRPGIVITAAAGDNGYLNWLEEPRWSFADYPASSPRVVAVGGTRLRLGESGEWSGETVWNDGGESDGLKSGNGAGGGGCSSQFDAQPWQQSLPSSSALGCDGKRAVADVSADADPDTGVALYESGPACETTYEEGKAVHTVHWCTYGGTSLASPLIASVFALAGGSDGVEYPAETLYENEAQAPASLHDVTEGSNGECLMPFDEETDTSACTPRQEAEASCAASAICLAGAGYDGPTGLGTPDGIAAFIPPPRAPTATTSATSSIAQSSATLHASVNPNGDEASTAQSQSAGVGVSASQAHRKPVPNVELASTELTESSAGTVSLRVSCPAAARRCAGTVTLRTLDPVRAGPAAAYRSAAPKAVILTLAVASFKLAGGRVTSIKLDLSARARVLLAHTHMLRARVTIFARDPAGTTHTARATVTIRAHSATHGSRQPAIADRRRR